VTYHVDLLFEYERRSASPINAGLVMRMGSVLAVGVVLLATLFLFFTNRDLQSKIAQVDARWEHYRPEYEALQKLRGNLNETRASMRQLQACRRTRLEWGKELDFLQRGVPENVQLTALRVNQFVGSRPGTGTFRSYELRLTGKIVGENAKEDVDALIAYLSSPVCQERIDSVTVPTGGFRRESVRTAGGVRTVWYFELICRYRPRSFE